MKGRSGRRGYPRAHVVRVFACSFACSPVVCRYDRHSTGVRGPARRRTRGGAPFGRMLTAMVTPFTADGALDADGAARLATYLVDDMATTAWSSAAPPVNRRPPPTRRRTACCARSSRRWGTAPRSWPGSAPTTPRTPSSWPGRQNEPALTGCCVVTPYYNKPPQDGLLAHFTAVADATGLPCMLYDIPGRTGTPIATETLIRLAEHPRIVAVKDAKGDFGAASQVMARDRPGLLLRRRHAQPAAAVGRRGRVRQRGRPRGRRPAARHDRRLPGRATSTEARQIHLDLLPVFTGS